MGYGGIDFGYLVSTREKFTLGAKLLIAGGAVFKETAPESKGNGFKLFPVLEPTVYYQSSLNKLFRPEWEQVTNMSGEQTCRIFPIATWEVFPSKLASWQVPACAIKKVIC